MAYDLTAANPSWFPVDDQGGDNVQAHYLTTGPEIYEGTNKSVTHFITGASTGGTISGVGKYLKEKNPEIKVIMADAEGSILKEHLERLKYTSQHEYKLVTEARATLVEGVGATKHIPRSLDTDYIDSAVWCSDKEAFAMCHRLAREEGLSLGSSSGLNVHAALELARTVEEPAVIVTLLTDPGLKYLSKVYNPEWLRSHQIPLPKESNFNLGVEA